MSTRKSVTVPARPYVVGYGRPPVATRFKKGQSGNPGGRARKPTPAVANGAAGLDDHLLTTVLAVAQELVSIEVAPGVVRRVTREEALVRGLFERAEHDPRAAKLVLELHGKATRLVAAGREKEARLEEEARRREEAALRLEEESRRRAEYEEDLLVEREAMKRLERNRRRRERRARVKSERLACDLKARAAAQEDVAEAVPVAAAFEDARLKGEYVEDVLGSRAVEASPCSGLRRSQSLPVALAPSPALGAGRSRERGGPLIANTQPLASQGYFG